MRAFALVLLLMSFAVPAAASAAPGDLDRGFGSSGTARITVAGLQTSTSLVAEQPRGRIIVGVSLSDPGQISARRTYSLYALTPGGRLDRTYGRRGRVGNFPDGTGVMLPDGRVVLAEVLPREGGSSLQLVALTPDGRSDDAFGTGGRVSVPVQEANPYTPVIVVAPDGHLVVALNTMRAGSIETVTLLRFTPDGALDASFGTDGQVVVSVLPDDLSVPLVAVQRSGRIVVVAGRVSDVGLGGSGTLLAGLDPDGRLDTGFGGNDDGMHSRIDGEPVALAIAPDDGIVLADTESRASGELTARVRRVGPEGAGAGTATAMPTAGEAVPRSLVIDSRGSAIVSVETSGGATSGVGVMRFTTAGFDRAFSPAPLLGGILGGGGPRAIALQRDGGILVTADDGRYAPRVRSTITIHRIWGGYDARRPVVRARCRRGARLLTVAVSDASALAELVVAVRGGRSHRTTRKRLRLLVPTGRRLTVRALDASGNATIRRLTCR